MPQSGPGSTTFGNGSAPRTAWERLSQTFLRPAAPPKAAPEEPPDFSTMTDDEKRARIIAIDPGERRVGIAAAILAVALAIYANVPYMISKTAVATTVKPKHGACAGGLQFVKTTNTCNGVYAPSHYVLPLAITLILAAAIYVTVRIRRRSPLAFALVMTGLAFGTLFVLLPYGAAGAWVMFRAWRTQKYGSPSAKTAVAGWTPPPPRGTTRRARSAGPAGSRRRRGEPATPAARKPPVANKRYTPKTPPPAAKK